MFMLSRIFTVQLLLQKVTSLSHYSHKSYYTRAMSRRQALLLSSSCCHGYNMLEFAKEDICNLLNKNKVTDIIFVPYAQYDCERFTTKMSEIIGPWGYNFVGLNACPDPEHAVYSAKAIFVGGGNTFLLLKRLYENNLVKLIKQRVDEGSLVYIGSSAGSNVATKSIHTTNDMPIIYPPSFDAIGIVPFNINPHYIEYKDSETHKGETRDQRILEYMQMPHAAPVLGMREGCILKIEGQSIVVKGVAGAVLFQKGPQKTDIPIHSDLSYLGN